MPANYQIKAEVIKIATDTGCCPGSAKSRIGETFIIGPRTPEPGMCGRAFHAIHPRAFAMRFTDKMFWEKPDGLVEVTCPDGFVIFRHSRITSD